MKLFTVLSTMTIKVEDDNVTAAQVQEAFTHEVRQAIDEGGAVSVADITYTPMGILVSVPTDPPFGICGLCGKEMPKGEEMFKYHGLTGPCPE